MKTTLFICLSILSTTVLGAADKPAAPAPGKEKEPAKEKEAAEQPAIELKNKSTYVVQTGSRDPFWPIGFKPAAKVSTSSGESASGDVAAGAFVVSTITIDSRGKFAIINGKPMVEGQQFGLQMGSQTYQISVKRIEDGRVVLGRRDQEIVVPLRRK